jgi:predicted MFS family arabinose efflux permease
MDALYCNRIQGRFSGVKSLLATPSDTKELPIEADARLWPLVLGNFAVGTGVLIVTGLLPLMARDLGQSVSAMGQAVTAFAIAVAVGGPLLAGPTSRLDRRRLLVVAMLLTAVGHLVCAVAPEYWSVLAGRVIAGVGAGLFTPHAATAAALIAGPERRGRAIALVFIGFTASTVLGVPIGTILADVVGWRATLAMVGGLALLAAIWVRVQVPGALFAQSIDRASWRQVTRMPRLQLILATTLLQSLGQLTLLTYVAAVHVANIGASNATVGALFAVNGIAGIFGNLASGRLVDRHGASGVVAGLILIVAVAFALFPLGASGLGVSTGLMLLWGIGAFSINSVQQPRLIATAPALATATLPLNSAAIYAGQAVGALIGGAIVAGHVPGLSGIVWLGPVAAAFMLAALVTSLAADRVRA